MIYHSEYHLATQFSIKLEDYLRNRSYSFLRDVIVNNDERKRIDLLITKNNIPFAGFEFKNRVYLNNKKQQKLIEDGIKQAKAYAEQINCKFFFLVLGENEIYDCSTIHGNHDYYQQLYFNNLVELLRTREERYRPLENEIFKSVIYPLLDKEKRSIVSLLEKNLSCNQDDNTFIFNGDKEKDFWNILLKDVSHDKKIYRYTTLNTLFAMIDNLSYRMCGIVGMNDTSEIDFFDKYCKSNKKALTKNYGVQNKKFISSFSEHGDKLTMWRLYGDDAKGVCLEYEYLPTDRNLFHLRKVSYANENKKHPALDLIKSLIQAGVTFKEIDKWKHFFKPYEYHVENEIRLLYVNDQPVNGISQKWVSTATHSIFNPVIDISLSKELLPLQLTKIILGAKCPEKHTNKYQIREMLKDKVKKKICELNLTNSDPVYWLLDSIANAEIEISSIRNYR